MNDTRIRSAVAALRANAPEMATAALAGAAGVLGSYAVASLRPGFVAAPIAGFTARAMPGAVITFTILVLGELGQKLNLATAIVASVLLLAGAAAAAVAVARRIGHPIAAPPLAALGGWLIAVALTGAPVAALGAGLGTGVAVGTAGIAERTTRRAGEEPTAGARRRVLGSLAAAVGVALAGALFGRSGGSGSGGTGGGGGSAAIDEPVGDPEEVEALLSEAREKSFDVAGIEPLVSESFYQVDINAVDPDLGAAGWTLSVTGAVERELEFDYAEVRAMPAENRFISLRCVGESLNGHKMDNALWTGTPIARLVEEAAPRGGCECVMLRAADGYYEEFPLAALRRGFLAYGMNGRTLPREHGHPVRALIPGHWGEINVKWLTEIEILDRRVDGYWEERGWHGTGPVNTVAKLHAVNRLGDGRVQVGGHAYAGVRGIDRVEVSTDGGETWAEAELSEPLPGEDVWRQWAYEYDPPGRPHEVVVRATDGEGALQPRDESRAFPSGATGWVSRTVRA